VGERGETKTISPLERSGYILLERITVNRKGVFRNAEPKPANKIMTSNK